MTNEEAVAQAQDTYNTARSKHALATIKRVAAMRAYNTLQAEEDQAATEAKAADTALSKALSALHETSLIKA